MRQVSPYQYKIARAEPFDVVAHKLHTRAPVKLNQLHVDVDMPAVIDVWYPILSYAERL